MISEFQTLNVFSKGLSKACLLNLGVGNDKNGLKRGKLKAWKAWKHERLGNMKVSDGNMKGSFHFYQRTKKFGSDSKPMNSTEFQPLAGQVWHFFMIIVLY